MFAPAFLDKFMNYVEGYPESDEPGYDGIHDGGIKGIRDDAPESAKQAFAEYMKRIEEGRKKGIKY